MLCIISVFILVSQGAAGQLTARLVNGTRWSGRLEIWYNGTWGTVCDDYFGKNEAQVACRMLGFNSSQAFPVTSAVFGPGQNPILLDDLSCHGTETSLSQCSHSGFFIHNCQHSEDIGIDCNISGQLTARLVNGTRWSGRLEIWYNGTWGTVCDDNFEKNEAQVACRMLGFNSSQAFPVTSAVFGPGQNPILLDDLSCHGTETSLSQCSHSGFFIHNCQHSEDIGIDCNISGQLTARLVNGTRWSGRLEIWYNGTWGTVCDDNFGKNEAQVACRMLGFNRYSSQAFPVTSAVFGPGQNPILLDDLSCHGTETSLSQCSHSGFFIHNCQHSEDIGIDCNISGQLTARLVNGTRWSGRLEIWYNGTWGTVCDDNFGKNEAQVACRMLGFNSPEASPVGSAVFGPGKDPILLDDLSCHGTETSLSQCSHSGFYTHDCQHSEDVGIDCNISGQLTARLVNGTRWSGRLEILYRGTWGTVCDDNFGKNEAQIACRMLGFNSSQAFPVSSAVFGPGQNPILLDDLSCHGTETSLSQCSHLGFYIHDCEHSEDVGIICSISTSELRLAGSGRTRLDTGRVEIMIDRQWNMVCGALSSITAKAICKFLGFPSSEAVSTDASSFGPLEGRYLYPSPRCVGNETDITGCFQSIDGYTDDCTLQPGVICTDISRPLYILVETNSTTTSYPSIEGKNVTLKCENVNTSQIVTQYTWPDTAGGQPSGQYLVFDNVTRAHHGRPVRCMASYDPSVNRQPSSSETLVMQVYYHPAINVTCYDSACEQIKSSPSAFAVTEGKHVAFLCKADSSPPPASIEWSGINNSNNERLDILSPNRSMNGSRLTCKVVTKQFPDERLLSLESYYEITIIIKESISPGESSAQVGVITGATIAGVVVVVAVTLVVLFMCKKETASESAVCLVATTLASTPDLRHVYDSLVMGDLSEQTVYTELSLNPLTTADGLSLSEPDKTERLRPSNTGGADPGIYVNTKEITAAESIHLYTNVEQFKNAPGMKTCLQDGKVRMRQNLSVLQRQQWTALLSPPATAAVLEEDVNAMQLKTKKAKQKQKPRVRERNRLHSSLLRDLKVATLRSATISEHTKIGDFCLLKMKDSFRVPVSVVVLSIIVPQDQQTRSCNTSMWIIDEVKNFLVLIESSREKAH